MGFQPTPLKRLISLARDSKTIYKILKAEGLLSELGLNQSEQIIGRIVQIKSKKYYFEMPPGSTSSNLLQEFALTPSDIDYIEEFLLGGYLNEDGEKLTGDSDTSEQWEEAYQKALFYASDLTTTCRHCKAEVSANIHFCGYCGQLMISEKDNEATLIIKFEDSFHNLGFCIGGKYLNIKPNENYPLLLLWEGTYCYQVEYNLNDYRGILSQNKYNFVGGESYDLIFSVDDSSPNLQIVHKTISD